MASKTAVILGARSGSDGGQPIRVEDLGQAEERGLHLLLASRRGPARARRSGRACRGAGVAGVDLVRQVLLLRERAPEGTAGAAGEETGSGGGWWAGAWPGGRGPMGVPRFSIARRSKRWRLSFAASAGSDGSPATSSSSPRNSSSSESSWSLQVSSLGTGMSPGRSPETGGGSGPDSAGSISASTIASGGAPARPGRWHSAPPARSSRRCSPGARPPA